MRPRPFVCFVHIERAGGTTLNEWLQRSLPGFYTAHTWYYWSNEPEHILAARELHQLVRFTPGMSGVGGHTVRSWPDYEAAVGRPVQRVTFLRRPTDRFMSHFNYQRLVNGVPWTLEAFLAEPRFQNFQTIRLAGDESLKGATDQLARFAFVGFSEAYDASLRGLAAALGVARFAEVPPRNALAGRGDLIRYDELGSAQQRSIDLANELDQQLYDHAAERYLPAILADDRNRATRVVNGRVSSSMLRYRQRVWAASIEAVVHRVAGGTKPPWAGG